ncbi:MAG: hypothetical protein COU90_03190 [Candidatus Ryanbacteria bacterium CG10_big_fil_rev_8_21_14_0_10_43_42]|uniref:RlpA-like protein double-psi beta-barrel domain-containing protein n=1 Tax=Candidatus Ryanbacteria bacterium CG10_big_fil_rev_8_21_14_0_10_43_42 TaxID=1974864 RepID=A0A2M8KWX3_9BACT|nr:MAG: hypothetical protein COU90_03190 [Candidatus Ryanbacteria bacterium CG10_big_fil_rev_8_21_14_0_10_43_42]
MVKVLGIMAVVIIAYVMCVVEVGARVKGMFIATTYRQQKIASWYGPGFWGKRTACGNIYTGRQLTAAHMDLGDKFPCGTRIRVTNLRNGKSAVLTIDDTGNFARYGRVLDVSYAAAKKLGFLTQGTAPVQINVLP